MGKIVAIVGIAFVAFGTILSIWSVLITKTMEVGTYAYMDGENQQKGFIKQKTQVIIGMAFILFGSVLQCIALFL